MTVYPFNLNNVEPSWTECLNQGLAKVNAGYLQHLSQSKDWLPGPEKIFNAFSLPIDKVNYVLFGESPYPRKQSANGYAFWDDSVHDLWSPSGLSKKVNRATSLRNLLKMLLIAEGRLDKNNVSQDEIAKVDKSNLVKTNDELFKNFLNHGFLLLNATPVLQPHSPHKDARAWYPFTKELLNCLLNRQAHVKFILLGRIAETIDKLMNHLITDKLCAEHPYNHSFITNTKILNFFKPLHLLRQQ